MAQQDDKENSRECTICMSDVMDCVLRDCNHFLCLHVVRAGYDGEATAMSSVQEEHQIGHEDILELRRVAGRERAYKRRERVCHSVESCW